MTAPSPPSPRTGALRAQAVLVGIALVAGLAIATVHELTRPMVHAKRGDLLGDAALAVLPNAVNYRTYARGSDGSLAPLRGTDGAELFLGLDASGKAVGVAIAGSGMGYQDTIRLVVGLDPRQGRLLGMRVVASRETPGLGSLIVDDADFVSGFSSVVLRFDGEGDLLPLRVREQARHEHGEIDAISGATVSVRAVARIINTSLAEWLPLLRVHYEDLAGGKHG
jgi:Na+-translocating ferredoxin:NAD+ oxidoreductase subunit G